MNGAAEVKPKEAGCCEDAHFLHRFAVGVSDGVGGWANYGLTAAQFSESLMENCKRIIENMMRPSSAIPPTSFGANSSSVQDSILFDVECEVSADLLDDSKTSDRYHDSRILGIDPVNVISGAYEKVRDLGSATAVVCVLKNEDLICCNIGDSGFRLVRFDETNQPFVVMQSEEQQHDFNTPYSCANFDCEGHRREADCPRPPGRPGEDCRSKIQDFSVLPGPT